jgi:hypothetical protein
MINLIRAFRRRRPLVYRYADYIKLYKGRDLRVSSAKRSPQPCTR